MPFHAYLCPNYRLLRLLPLAPCAASLWPLSAAPTLLTSSTSRVRGSREVAELAAAWQACGYGLPLAEAAGAAWRKQAALQWHAQQWEQAPEQRQVSALLAALNDAGGLASMQQQLSAAQPVVAAVAPQPPQLPVQPAVPQLQLRPQSAAHQPQLSSAAASRKEEEQQLWLDDSAAAEESQGMLPPLPSSPPPPPLPPASSDSAPPPPALDAVAVLSGVPAGDLPVAHAALATALYRAVPASEPGAAAKRAALSTLLRLGLSPYGVHGGTFRQLPVPASQVQEALREVSWQRQRLQPC